MPNAEMDIKALAEAFELFTRTTQSMEESYRLLEARMQELDRELAVKNRELAFTSDYLHSILEGMSDGVIAVNTDGIVTTFNQAATRVLGYRADETIGLAFSDVFGREFPAPPGRNAMEWRTKSGEPVLVSECDSPLSDRDGKRIGSVKVFQDLTEIEALRTRVRQKDRLAALGEMAATVAHEIRNPLGGIRGFAALLARDIEEDDPRARLVDRIQVGAKELERVVNELLEYTRPIQLQLQTVSCKEAVEASLSYLTIDSSMITVRNEVSPDLRVMADAHRLRQTLMNILLNAAQSIESRGEIRVWAEKDSGLVRLAVSDTGCGMSADQLEKVFSPFFTTKEKGTGLGLAIASKIVESHGGAIRVESEPGNGSTFYIALPSTE
ncbi:MAG: PAS domain S-box protein [Candidatus Hydrogenedentes bacterium]|nr:PAS domain S-box protein [Candidatus Hydrogenedentota bacterium]